MIFVDSLELKDFRIFSELELNFKNGMNVISGKNGSGKTSIIESIFLSCTKSSFRYFSNSNELIKNNTDFSNIHLDVHVNKRIFNIITKIYKEKPLIIEVNNKKSKPSQYKELFQICVFTPDDLQIIKNSSSERRKFFDIAMCQVFNSSYTALKRFNTILKNRNSLLKSRNYSKTEKEVFDIQYINSAIEVNKYRLEIIKLFNENLSFHYDEISSLNSNIEIILNVNGINCLEIDQIIQEYQKQYDRLFNAEVDRGYSLFGPQRDEIIFNIDSKDARVQASQGEQRTIALALKLSNIDIIEKKLNIVPLLLLDDVVSELDGTRREKLLEVALKGQSIITTTENISSVHNIINLDEIKNEAHK